MAAKFGFSDWLIGLFFAGALGAGCVAYNRGLLDPLIRTVVDDYSTHEGGIPMKCEKCGSKAILLNDDPGYRCHKCGYRASASKQ
jgi:ribosomal protein S27AE